MTTNLKPFYAKPTPTLDESRQRLKAAARKVGETLAHLRQSDPAAFAATLEETKRVYQEIFPLVPTNK